MLSKISGRSETVIGSPTAGRRHADLSSTIGMFVNTLALKNHIQPHETFTDFLLRVKENTLEAFENQDYPFEELVEQVSVTRDVSRNPLFDIMFVLQNMDFPEIQIPGLEVNPYRYSEDIAKFDLSLYAAETHDDISLSFEYCIRLFTPQTIQRFIAFFQTNHLRCRPGLPNRLSRRIELISGGRKEENIK